MGLSVLTQLQSASPITQLNSEYETSVEQSAEVCVPLHEHTGTSPFPAPSELERKINIINCFQTSLSKNVKNRSFKINMLGLQCLEKKES